MKKKILVLLLMIAVIAVFSGCGSNQSGEPQNTDSGNEPVQADDENPDGTEAEPGEELSDVLDLTTGTMLTLHNGYPVLHMDSTLEKENEYSVDWVYAEIMSDRAIDMGWEYYYLDTDKDGEPVKIWTPDEGLYTVLVILDLFSRNEEPVRFGDMAKIKVVFDEGGKDKVYEGIALQSNPGQISEEGYEKTRSTKFLDVEKDEESSLGFFIDVDSEFHNAFTKETVKEPTWAYIDFDNGDKYCMNLREDMIVFGYDDSDSDSRIVKEVHRTLEAAVGSEYLEEFLRGNEAFMKSAEKAGLDVKDAAEKLASYFEIHVCRIDYADDTEATATCTYTHPDFSLISDYADLDNVPTVDEDMDILFVLTDLDENHWIPEDRDAAEKQMRAALDSF